MSGAVPEIWGREVVRSASVRLLLLSFFFSSPHSPAMALFGQQAGFGGFEDKGDETASVPEVPGPVVETEAQVVGEVSKGQAVTYLLDLAKEHKVSEKVVAGMGKALDLDPSELLIADFAYFDESDVTEMLAGLEVEGKPANRIHKSQVLRLFATSRAHVTRLGLVIPGYVPPAPTSSTTPTGPSLMTPTPKAAAAPAPLPKTVYKMATYIDQAEEGVFHMLPLEDLTRMRNVYHDMFGDEPPSHERPSDEQLSGLKSRLDSGRAPYVDFGVFGQFNRRTTFFRKFEDQVLIDGRFRTMVIKGPANFVQWKSSWRIFRNAMVMLGAGVPAHFDKYEEGVRQLMVAHGNSAWATVAIADDLMRSEEWQLVYDDHCRRGVQITDKVWSQICSDTAFRVGEGVRTHWWWERVTAPLARGDPTKVIAEMEGNELGVVANASVHAYNNNESASKRSGSFNPRPRAKAKMAAKPVGACWAWNDGACQRPCPHNRPHVCSQCGGNHRVSDCPTSGSKTDKSNYNGGGGKGKGKNRSKNGKGAKGAKNGGNSK